MDHAVMRGYNAWVLFGSMSTQEIYIGKWWNRGLSPLSHLIASVGLVETFIWCTVKDKLYAF